MVSLRPFHPALRQAHVQAWTPLPKSLDSFRPVRPPLPSPCHSVCLQGLEPTFLLGYTPRSLAWSRFSAKLWCIWGWVQSCGSQYPSFLPGQERDLETCEWDQEVGWMGDQSYMGLEGGKWAGLGTMWLWGRDSIGLGSVCRTRAEPSPTWAVHGAASWPPQGASLWTGSGPGRPGGCWHSGGSHC